MTKNEREACELVGKVVSSDTKKDIWKAQKELRAELASMQETSARRHKEIMVLLVKLINGSHKKKDTTILNIILTIVTPVLTIMLIKLLSISF